MKTHGQSLNDGLFYRLITEVKVILKSQPLTVKTLNDTCSYKPLSPEDLLTMKSKVVLSHPAQF